LSSVLALMELDLPSPITRCAADGAIMTNGRCRVTVRMKTGDASHPNSALKTRGQ
jgi:hypothetical protein